MHPYTAEEADWLAARPAAPTGAIRAAITGARRRWLRPRAAAVLKLVGRLATAIRRALHALRGSA